MRGVKRVFDPDGRLNPGKALPQERRHDGMRVLVADDEKSITVTLEEDLREAGHDVKVAANGDDAWRLLEKDRFDCLISDINMPGMKGDELLRRAKAADPSVAVILVTGYGSIDSAVRAMKDGAADYILKPFRNDQIVHALAKLGKLRSLEAENENLRSQISEIAAFENIVGQSPAMRAVIDLIRTVAKTDTTVLLQGETGTGKEVIARAIHNNGGRAKGAVHRDLVRGDPADAARGRALRARARRVHGRARQEARAIRARPGRHVLPRRHRRPGAHDPGEARARAAGARGRAARRRPADQGRHPRRSRRRRPTCTRWSRNRSSARTSTTA